MQFQAQQPYVYREYYRSLNFDKYLLNSLSILQEILPESDNLDIFPHDIFSIKFLALFNYSLHNALIQRERFTASGEFYC